MLASGVCTDFRFAHGVLMLLLFHDSLGMREALHFSLFYFTERVGDEYEGDRLLCSLVA